MELDVNKVIALYKQRVAELEHELILTVARCSELESKLEEVDQNKQ